DAAHERDLIHDAGRARQFLADDDTRGAGADRPVLPADLLGRVGLHVEGVVVTRPAELVQEDDGLGPRAAPPALVPFEGAGQQRTEQAQAADLEQPAAGQGVACLSSTRATVMHGVVNSEDRASAYCRRSLVRRQLAAQSLRDCWPPTAAQCRWDTHLRRGNSPARIPTIGP